MLDLGLLASVVVILAVLYAASRWAPVASMHPNETVDRLYMPAFAALLAGRVVAAALDDPTSLRSLRALLVLRGGVEFWPGALAGLAVLAWGLRRADRPVALDVAELVPFALWGYGAYELTCFLRDGCFGPSSPVGLIPDGLSNPQFPVGLVLGSAIVGLGFVLRHLWAASPVTKLVLAAGGVALLRTVASVWLPHLGSGPTRQHLESGAVAALAAFAVGGSWLARQRAAARQSDPAPADP